MDMEEMMHPGKVVFATGGAVMGIGQR